ncbi:hypothetical protein, partial [Rahnella aceris]|uniref:hypothetical protein n=1 Tax=Rahnella sp. (strain Y9602) TaxID=2703885 RepID=UPI001C27BA58
SMLSQNINFEMLMLIEHFLFTLRYICLTGHKFRNFSSAPPPFRGSVYHAGILFLNGAGF